MKVTPKAAQELRRILEGNAAEGETLLRLIIDPSERVVLVLDREREGDHVVQSEDCKVLVLEHNVAFALEGITIDCVDTPHGQELVLGTVEGEEEESPEEPEA